MSSPIEHTVRNAGAAREAEPLVSVERDARGVVRLTLNRPQAFNALSEALLAAPAGPSAPGTTCARCARNPRSSTTDASSRGAHR